MDCKNALLIVAAGRGLRLKSDVPKQYIEIAGMSILRHALEAFKDSFLFDHFQIVIHPDDKELFYKSVKGLENIHMNHGGKSRQESVLLGLEAMREIDPEFIWIHDAARPFVSQKILQNIGDVLGEYGAVIPALPVIDTLKKSSGTAIEETIDRKNLYRAQTPQAFRFKPLFIAHQRTKGQNLTDDASIAEAIKMKVEMIAGDENNFKITTTEDIEKAKKMINPPLTNIKIGTGLDVHAFEQGGSVILGGIKIPHSHKLKGHSDADAVLHALTDAILGAIAKGDIGKHFPPADDRWKDVSSDMFLAHAAKLVAELGGKIGNIDLTIICELPKISPHSDKIRKNIAQILKMHVDDVSVKATTTEKLGFTGRKEGIMVQASVLVKLPE